MVDPVEPRKLLPVPNHIHFVGLLRLETFFDRLQPGMAVAWMQKLIEDQSMEIMTGPHAFYTYDEDYAGWTILTGIKTSHCAIHVWDEQYPVRVDLDFFTCGDLNHDKLVDAFRQFGILRWQERTFNRADNFDEIGGVERLIV